jgi:hypothetical protein
VALMLIHTWDEPPEPPAPPREFPDLRPWVGPLVAVGLIVTAPATPPALGAVQALSGLAILLRSIARLTGDWDGMSQYRA